MRGDAIVGWAGVDSGRTWGGGQNTGGRLLAARAGCGRQRVGGGIVGGGGLPRARDAGGREERGQSTDDA
jgi:hypothetical protein